jgi:hypothetical protein
MEEKMPATKRLPAFEKFIQDLRAAWAELPDTESRMKKGQKLLEELVRDPSLQQASKSWPSTEGRKNLLFYQDPDYGFAINGVVRVPGRKGSIHDHAHSWTAYALLDGTESLERYRRIDGGTKEGYAKLELESVTDGKPGKSIWSRPLILTPNRADRRDRSPSFFARRESRGKYCKAVTTWRTTPSGRSTARRTYLTRSLASSFS